MIDFAASSDGVCWRNYASPGVLRPVALAKESTRGINVGEHILRSKNTRKQQCTISLNIRMWTNAQHLSFQNNDFKGKVGKSDASPKKVAK